MKALGFKWKCALACAAIALLASIATYWGLLPPIQIAWLLPHAGPKHTATPQIVATKPERVTRSGRDSIHVPAEVAAKMGLQTADVSVVQTPIKLPGFQGVLALDNDRLSRVHSRFGGEVVELGRSTDGSDPTLHVGEHVQQGDLLAVIWSTELGEKKSALVDAMVKANAEEQLRDRLKKLFEEGAGAGRNYRDAEKDVQARHAEIASLERTLRTWRVTDEDIEDIHAEAKHLTEESKSAIKPSDWARVEVRAPISGVVLEKNVVVGDIIDTVTDLFKIGDLSQLVVWAHVYEEDLSLLESLPKPIPWALNLPSSPGTTFSGTLDKIGAIIDPTQHTGLVTGRVDNLSGKLKIGQFVGATVQLPPPGNELELPAAAVVEDGRESVVFIQPDPKKSEFIRRSVSVIRRLRENVYIKNVETGVHSGDRVVTSGALMLQNAMSQLPLSNPSQGVDVTRTDEQFSDVGGIR